MGQAGDFFDALYTQFIMKDVAGKALPGLILLGTIGGLWVEPPLDLRHLALKDLPKVPIGAWIVLLFLCWVVGVAIQGWAI